MVGRNGNNNFKGPYKFYDRCKTAPVFRENNETGSMLCYGRRRRYAYIIKFATFTLCVFFYITCLHSIRNSIFSYTHYTYYIQIYLVCSYNFISMTLDRQQYNKRVGKWFCVLLRKSNTTPSYIIL